MWCFKLAVNCNERWGTIRKGCTERIGTHWSMRECQPALMGTSFFNLRPACGHGHMGPMGQVPYLQPAVPSPSPGRLFGTHENVTRTHENLLKWAFRAPSGSAAGLEQAFRAPSGSTVGSEHPRRDHSPGSRVSGLSSAWLNRICSFSRNCWTERIGTHAKHTNMFKKQGGTWRNLLGTHRNATRKHCRLQKHW